MERGLGRRHETERQVGERGRHGGMDGKTISRTREAKGVTTGKTWGRGEVSGVGRKVSGPGGGIIAKENPSSVPSHL